MSNLALRGLLLVVATLFLVSPVVAQDATGCEDLEDYATSIEGIGSAFDQDLEDSGFSAEGTPDRWSPENFDDYAALVESASQTFAEIEPPAFASQWHEAVETRLVLQVQIALTASSTGYAEAVDVHAEAIQENAEAFESAAALASEICPEFAAFADELGAPFAGDRTIGVFDGLTASGLIVPDLEITAPIDGRTAGETDAPIVVVEWGDYQ